MDKKPYTPPTFSPIPLPDSPLPLMVSGFKVGNIHTGGVRDQGEGEEVEADSKENPWHTHSLWDDDANSGQYNYWGE